MMRSGQELRDEEAELNKPEPKIAIGTMFRLNTTVGFFKRTQVQINVIVTDVEYGMHGVFEDTFLDYEYLYTLTAEDNRNFFYWESDLIQ